MTACAAGCGPLQTTGCPRPPPPAAASPLPSVVRAHCWAPFSGPRAPGRPCRRDPAAPTDRRRGSGPWRSSRTRRPTPATREVRGPKAGCSAPHHQLRARRAVEGPKAGRQRCCRRRPCTRAGRAFCRTICAAPCESRRVRRGDLAGGVSPRPWRCPDSRRPQRAWARPAAGSCQLPSRWQQRLMPAAPLAGGVLSCCSLSSCRRVSQMDLESASWQMVTLCLDPKRGCPSQSGMLFSTHAARYLCVCAARCQLVGVREGVRDWFGNALRARVLQVKTRTHPRARTPQLQACINRPHITSRPKTSGRAMTQLLQVVARCCPRTRTHARVHVHHQTHALTHSHARSLTHAGGHLLRPSLGGIPA